MAKKFLIPSAKNESLSSCDHCLAKNNIGFPLVADLRIKLELVHSIVYGPMDMETLGENRYFITFIDDILRRYGFIFLY